jgi:hypothetical protein|tara:strand:- start:178 stop:651 length:474 start_codon:yes stop_codon:yes gene_type:complete
MKKNFILLILFGIFLTQCGYSSIYSNRQNITFKITSIDMSGDFKINNLIKANLTKYTTGKQNKEISVKLNTEYQKKILTKDSTGAPTNFELSVDTTLEANVLYLDGNSTNHTFKFSESTNIKNDDDNFEQKKYEEIVKKNIAITIANQITINLTNIR